MKLIKTLPIAILGLAVTSLVGCADSYPDYKFYKLIEEVPPTCTLTGLAAHYESISDKKEDRIYLNVDKKKVNYEDLIIPAAGHQMTYHPEQYATCDKEGIAAYYHCDKCDLNFEDESGEKIITDLTKGTRGHVMDIAWTPSIDGEYHYHKCAREGCNYTEDETACSYTEEVVKDEYKKDGEDNTYYKSCVCGRKSPSETFTITPEKSISTDSEGWQDEVKTYSSLEEHDPTFDNLVTLGDIGINGNEYVTIPDTTTKKHLFGHYDMYDNGIELTYNCTFHIGGHNTDSYMFLYFGNQYNEDGLQIRLMTNRIDKFLCGYYYSTSGGLVKSDGTPFYSGCDNSSFFLTEPFTGTKWTREARINIRLTPAPNKSTDTHDMYKIEISINGNKFHKEEGGPAIDDLYVGYPRGYFRDPNNRIIHNVVRISFFSNDEGKLAYAKVKNVDDMPSYLSLMDDNNKCIGATANGVKTVTLPNLTKDGYKFIGYYDTRGNRITSETEINNIKVVYPHFIKDSDDPGFKNLTLSDLNFIKPGRDNSITNNEIASGYEEGGRKIPVDDQTNHIQISFVAKFKFATPIEGRHVDDYFQFGLPYDYKDDQTRFLFRINSHSSVQTLEGYMGDKSNSLGAHGPNNYYSYKDFAMIEEVSYLISLSYEKGTNRGLRYTLYIKNLADFNSVTISHDNVYFLNSDEFSFTNPYRNYFTVVRSRNDANLTMNNAW